MVFTRSIQSQIEKYLFQKKAIIIYGARQVGKTTLIREFQRKYDSQSSIYLNCDEPDIRNAFTEKTSTELRAFLGNNTIVFIDEAQRIKNIGITLKLIIDNFPEIQIVATGSSSFDLSNKISEPLTGRVYEFFLYPFSYEELVNSSSLLETGRLLERYLIYGMYPEVTQSHSPEVLLKNLSRNYLYKDVLQYQDIRHSEVLEKLLQALALQIGQEVSFNELASTVGVERNTVSRYLELLEKSFIVFRLKPFSRNARNELKKLRKIYFFDLGIRNAIINNMNSMELRNDVGALWENFMIVERLKKQNNHGKMVNRYFWRTKTQQEIDYLEEVGNELSAFEFKWAKDSQKKWRVPKAFHVAYPEAQTLCVNQSNFESFLL